MAASETEAQQMFRLMVDSLEADHDALRELLGTRLRHFSADVSTADARLVETSGSGALEIVKTLSHAMQDLDGLAGEVEASRGSLQQARAWALLLPNGEVLDR